MEIDEEQEDTLLRDEEPKAHSKEIQFPKLIDLEDEEIIILKEIPSGSRASMLSPEGEAVILRTTQQKQYLSKSQEAEEETSQQINSGK